MVVVNVLAKAHGDIVQKHKKKLGGVNTPTINSSKTYETIKTTNNYYQG